MIGETIAHYKITAKIGEGGMGEVYLAEDTKLHRQVALKFLPQSLRHDPEARERLAREAQAASRLSHPNIVTVHAIDEYEGRDFIAMEYVDGKPVDEYCRQKSQGLEETLGIAIGLTSGLSKAHEAGIIHRDLKPSNVLVEKDGRARILDFGLAKIEGATKLTKTGSTVGTVAYMSPEQARGDEADQRSDIFSFGVILYEMISGHAPFGGDHEAAILYAIANEEPEPLARYKKDVPTELQRIVSKCIEKRRKDRYQSAADLATDLKQIKRAMAPPSSADVSTRTKRPRAFRRIAVAVVSVVATAVILLILNPWKKTSEVPHQDSVTEKTLVVLPFDNLGSEKDEYFADGITDEITSRLAQIPGLHVISRTSAMQYKNTDKGLRQIGEELGVAYVLEGTIRWDKSGDTSRVRITPQLIEVDKDFHIWAANYERAVKQIFAVQSDIASHIASALNVALAGESQQSRPTTSPDAYAYYLRGMEYLLDDWNSLTNSDAFTAVELFEKAIALDSNFAEPYAGIGLAIAGPLWTSALLGEEETSAKARESIETALQLAPDLALGHLAMGVYYNWLERDYESALEEFNQARELGGDEGRVLVNIAEVQMRQGRWVEAEKNLIEAAAHDPRSMQVLETTYNLYGMLHRFDDALQINERALSFAPNQHGLYSARAGLLILGKGDTAQAKQVVEEGISRLKSKRILGPFGADVMFQLWRFKLVDVTPDEVRASFTEDFSREELESEVHSLARVFDLNGLRDSAMVYYDSVIGLLEADLEHNPTDFHLFQSLGISCVLAGYHEKALEYARTGMEVMPISSCHW